MDNMILLGDAKVKAQGHWKDIAHEFQDVHAAEDNESNHRAHHSQLVSANEAALDKVRVMQEQASDLSQTPKGEGVYRKLICLTATGSN